MWSAACSFLRAVFHFITPFKVCIFVLLSIIFVSDEWPGRFLPHCTNNLQLLYCSFTPVMLFVIVTSNYLPNTAPLYALSVLLPPHYNLNYNLPFPLFQTSSTPTWRWRCRMSKAQLSLCGGTSPAGNRISCCKLLNTDTERSCFKIYWTN